MADIFNLVQDDGTSLFAVDDTGIVTAAGATQATANTHLSLNTQTDTNTVRLNARNYAATSGDIVGYQARPAANAAGTTSVYGSQVSPRFNDTITGSNLIGVSAEPILKGSSGNISGDVRALQATITDTNEAGRTIAGDVVGLRVWHQISATVTGDVAAISIEGKGGATPYTCALKLDGNSGLAGGTGGASIPASTRFIEVDIAGTKGKIAVYDD